MVHLAMAPPSTNWQDLCSLANLLRDCGDKVLSGNSKLCLNPALLTKLNAAFSRISLLGTNGDFHVTSYNPLQPPTSAQIHFLHDFVQKTVGLTIAGNGHCLNDIQESQPPDLSRFHSLRHLELRSCTIACRTDLDGGLHGLSCLRHQLETLVLVQVFHPHDLLWAILADEAVSVGPDVIWTKLSQLVVSYCRLRSFGRGLPLACNLQWLDVSHNELSDADTLSSSLAALPKLCYLNISYNRFKRIPVPSYGSGCPVPSKIQILLLSHNYIENLNGLQHMTSLRELNLEENQLESHSSLQPLRSLYQLQHVKLKGNPISYHKSHRILASSHLPPRAVFLKHRYRRDAVQVMPFMLDGQKLTKAELQTVQNGPISLSKISNESEHLSIDVSTESSKTPESSQVSGSEMERSTTRKVRKIREVIIEDFDSLEELADKNFTSNNMSGSIESSGEHMLTKRQVENVKAHYKEDWLRAHAGSTVQGLLGLETVSGLVPNKFGSSVASITSSARPLSSSTPLASPGLFPSAMHMAAPYPGHLDEQQFLESIILKRSPENRDHSEAQTTQSTEYHTANDSDTILHVSTGNDQTLSRENEAFPVSGYDGDEDDDAEEVDDVNDPEDGEDFGGDHSTYLVSRVTRGQVTLRDLFLVTSARSIKEIDPSSGHVIQQWRLTCLESCVLLSASPCQVQMTFNTVVPNKKNRVYEMDPNEAQKQLLPSLKTVLETRSLSALNVAAFRCMHCSGEFSMEINSRKAAKICPTCGSTLVFELDEAPLPSLGSISQVASNPLSPAPTGSTLIPEPTERSDLLHSPSDSSIGSAVSLESPGGIIQPGSDYPSTISSSGLRRCESDIDIISNPSQSSIEILDDVSRTSGTPGRKRSSEERQVVAIPSLVTVPEVSNPLVPLPSGLTESSSSGSVTDSVCTAYENNTGTGGMGLRRGAYGLAKSVLKEESSRENSPRYQEEPGNVEPSSQPTSLSNVLDNLLQTMSSKVSASQNMEKKQRKKNATLDKSIAYNYVDFSCVDHRLKLHLHLAILHADEHEDIQFLVRGEVFTCNPENRYPGILLISSEKVYILKITGPEEGDNIDRWISRVIAVPHKKLQSITPMPFGSGMWLSIQGALPSNIIIVVRDVLYSGNIFSFLKQMLDDYEHNTWAIVETPPENYTQSVMKNVQEFLKDELPDVDASLKHTALLCSSIVSKDNAEQNQTGGILLVSATSLLLTSDDMMWLLPPDVTTTPNVKIKCVGKQAISNLIQVESEGSVLCLQFLDEVAGKEETWKLTVQSEGALEKIVTAIRPLWEELFSVPLQVLQVAQT